MHLPNSQFSFIILNSSIPFLISWRLLPEHFSSDHWGVLGCPSRDHNTVNLLGAPALDFHTPTHLPGGFSLYIYLYLFLILNIIPAVKLLYTKTYLHILICELSVSIFAIMVGMQMLIFWE